MSDKILTFPGVDPAALIPNPWMATSSPRAYPRTGARLTPAQLATLRLAAVVWPVSKSA